MLADKLRICGVGRNKVVGIFMERCLEYTVSYIAILKAGKVLFQLVRKFDGLGGLSSEARLT